MSTPRSGKPTSFCATDPWGTCGRSGRTTPTASAASTPRQSDESIYLRFFAPIRELSDRDVYRFTHVDNVDRVALVMTVRGAIIGIGRWDRIDRRSAEVAFNISDHYQGKGIGSVLLEHLAAIAQELGVEQFTAEVLPQNRRMLNVFKEAGYAVHHHFEDGVVEVPFDIRPTEQSNAVRVAREHRAESVSMHGLLHPASIAVIGASRAARLDRKPVPRQHPRGRVCRSGLRGEQRGPRSSGTSRLRAGSARSPDRSTSPCWPCPADNVLDVVDECAAKGVRYLLVASAGFAESGAEGTERQEQLRRRARENGLRVVGPELVRA